MHQHSASEVLTGTVLDACTIADPSGVYQLCGVGMMLLARVAFMHQSEFKYYTTQKD